MRYGAKKDANHKQMAAVLEQLGVPFLDLSSMGCGIPDGLACVKGQAQLVEFKNPATAYGRRGLNPLQRKWADQWRGGCIYILRSVDDVVKLANNELDKLESVKCGNAWEVAA